MKNTFTYLLIAGLLMSFAVTGCKKKPGYLTRLPGRTMAPPPGDIGAGRLIGSQPPIDTTIPPTGIPVNNPGDHTGYIEDAIIFKANTVHFALDSATIRSEEKSKIGSVADYLKANSQAAVRVEGHCDERGTEEYNRSLGERRALALREELVSLGVSPDRVDTISYGEDRPVATGHDESAWKQNRRGEFILLTPPR